MTEPYESHESGVNFVSRQCWDYQVLFRQWLPEPIDVQGSGAANLDERGLAERTYITGQRDFLGEAIEIAEGTEDLARIAARRVRGARFRPYRDFREERES